MAIEDEITKQFALASCENHHLYALYDALSDKCFNKIKRLEDVKMMHHFYTEQLQRIQESYTDICQNPARNNINNELQELLERITYNREGMHIIQMVTITELTALLATKRVTAQLKLTAKTKKNEVQLALEKAYEYKNNMKILHETLALEDYPSLGPDFKQYTRIEKDLRELYAFLRDPFCDFSQQLLTAENKVTNTTRFILDTDLNNQGLGQKNSVLNKLYLPIKKYESDLTNLRQMIVGACKLALTPSGYTNKACITMFHLAQKSNPEAIRPAKGTISTETGARTSSLIKDSYETIRANRFSYFSQERLAEDLRLSAVTNERLRLSYCSQTKEADNRIKEEEKLSRFTM